MVRKLNIKILIRFLLVTCLLSSSAFAESLKVAVSSSASKYLPDTVARIVRALNTTGYDIEVSVLPDKRALLWASEGKMAMELYRTPAGIGDIPSLSPIQPPVQSLTFGMITSSKTPEFCTFSKEDLKKLSIVGLLGVEFYDLYFYPQFRTSTTVTDIMIALRLVSMQRADVSFFPQERLSIIPDDLSDQIIVCESNFETFHFHSFIHKNFLWAKDKIEAAYETEFSVK